MSQIRTHLFGEACHVLIDKGADTSQEILSGIDNTFSRLHEKFSPFAAESVVHSINQNAGTGAFTPIDAETRSLLRFVSALWSESSHLYDPTTRVLQECYDESGRLLANPDQLQGMLKLVGWKKLEITDAGARLTDKGMLIDFESCVRPYAIDSAAKMLREYNINNAMIRMEQDAATIGKQPDGANWSVGVRYPIQARAAITRIKLNNRCIAVRGNFERHTMENGERFGRALSPVDGQSIPGLLTVVVIADTCLEACSAASVARFKTEAAALQWLDKIGYPWMAIDRNLKCHGPLAP
jgi:thiamine biosynthesis lipoprotein